MAIAKEDWNSLSNMEKANVKRTTLEISVLAMTFALAALLGSGDDDDDDSFEKNNPLAYYTILRLRSELMFYIWIPAAWDLLRSPAASMSVLESTARLLQQLSDPTERYDRGKNKDDLKIYHDIVKMIPIWNQYYRLENVSETIKWFK